MSIINLSARQLRQAAALRERIDTLEKRLAGILNPPGQASQTSRQGRRPAKKAVEPAPRPKSRRRISKAARAKMAAAAKARWAKVKAAGKNSLKSLR